MQYYKIIIVGFGNIGKHLYEEFTENKSPIDIFVCDPNIEKPIYIKPDRFVNNISEITDKDKFDFAFICTPTEMKEDLSCDTSIVENVIRELTVINVDTIVIKSTVPITFCEMINKSVARIVLSPEYYGTTINSPKKPNFLILGGDKNLCTKVADLYYCIKSKELRIKFTDFRTAALAKYMENCFLAMKVAFCSEFSIIAKEFGISYPELREIFIMDERMGDSHTLIKQNQPFYDSHCLNKDIPGMISQLKEETLLLQAMSNINDARKSTYKSSGK